MKYFFNQSTWESIKKLNFLLFFMVISYTFTNGQSLSTMTGQNPSVVPQIKLAQKYDLTYYQPGTFNAIHVKDVLTNLLDVLSPGIAQGNSSSNEKFKFLYYTLILNDLKLDIAPELSLLDNLNPALKASSISKSEQKSIYNYTVSLF